MGIITNHQQIQICERLSKCSVEDLQTILFQAGVVSKTRGVACGYDTDIPTKDSGKPPQNFLAAIIYHLRKNSSKVRKIIKRYHNDLATMVYSLGLIAGNQYIISGDVNRMTLVYTVLMYFAKIGFDKVLAGSE